MALPVVPIFLITAISAAVGYGIRKCIVEDPIPPKQSSKVCQDEHVGGQDPIFNDEYVQKVNLMSLSQLENELKYVEKIHSKHCINKNSSEISSSQQMLVLIHTKIAELISCESEARKHWSSKIVAKSKS